MQRPRHREEISKAGPGDEKERRHQQEREEGLLLPEIKPGSDEPPDLRREHREADHQRGEEGDLHLDEKGLENIDIDQLALARAEQRLDQDGEDRLGEIEAGEEGGEQSRNAPQQAPPKLDQMVEQRRLALVDVADHGSGRSAVGVGSSSGAAGASNGKPGSWSAVTSEAARGVITGSG